MIKKIKSYFKNNISSLRAGMLFAIVVAIAVGVAIYFIVQAGIVNWVDNEYNSKESRESRYEGYISALQKYITDNEISSEDTSSITRWVRSNQNI